MEHAPEKRIEFLNIRPQDINTAVWIDYANKLEQQNSALLEALILARTILVENLSASMGAINKNEIDQINKAITDNS